MEEGKYGRINSVLKSDLAVIYPVTQVLLVYPCFICFFPDILPLHSSKLVMPEERFLALMNLLLKPHLTSHFYAKIIHIVQYPTCL